PPSFTHSKGEITPSRESQETYLSHNKPRSAPAAPCEKAARLTKRNGSRWHLLPTHVGPPSHYSDWRVNTKKSTKKRREKLAPEKSRDETHPITTPTSCVFCFLAIPSAYADYTTHYPLVAPFAWCSAGVRSRKRTANPGRSSKIGVMASAQHSSSTSNNNNNRHNEHLDDKPIPSSLPNLESSCHAPPLSGTPVACITSHTMRHELGKPPGNDIHTRQQNSTSPSSISRKTPQTRSSTTSHQIFRKVWCFMTACTGNKKIPLPGQRKPGSISPRPGIVGVRGQWSTRHAFTQVQPPA
ncbi:unnamed protein product, partial [Ectocarpus sp. 12 AP-2014]